MLCESQKVTKIVRTTGKIDYLEEEQKEKAAQMTRDDNVLLNDVYFNAYNMNHTPLTPLTPISKIVSVLFLKVLHGGRCSLISGCM